MVGWRTQTDKKDCDWRAWEMMFAGLTGVLEKLLGEVVMSERTKASKKGTADLSPAFISIVEETLSVRAQHTLVALEIRDAKKLMELPVDALNSTQHCGVKTSKEILKLRNNLRADKYGVSGTLEDMVEGEECFSGELGVLAINAILDGLNCRTKALLERLNVRTVDSFVRLSLLSIPDERGAGKVTLAEIHQMKTIAISFMNGSKEIKQKDIFAKFCERIFKEKISKSQEWLLDPDYPCAAFRQWAKTVSRGNKRREKAFLMRMGLTGKKAMTLEAIGNWSGITRERVRQLNVEFKDDAQWRVHRDRLKLIIERIAKTVRKHGGRMTKEELLNTIAEDSAQGKKLFHAKPFLSFISDFEVWKQTGLQADKLNVFFE